MTTVKGSMINWGRVILLAAATVVTGGIALAIYLGWKYTQEYFHPE